MVPGGQLSVGKRTGAPFPELHVAGRIQFSAAPEVFHPHDPLFHRAAPLQHDGTKPLSRQQIRRKHPRRPESGDDHRPGQRLRPPNDPEGLRFPIKDVEIPFGSRFLLPTAPELHRHGMDHADVRLFPGVQRGLGDVGLFHLLPGDPQFLSAFRTAASSDSPNEVWMLLTTITVFPPPFLGFFYFTRFSGENPAVSPPLRRYSLGVMLHRSRKMRLK